MTKKRLDPAAISNELRGGSLHFMRPSTPVVPSVEEHLNTTEAEKPRNLETYESRNLGKEAHSDIKLVEEKKPQTVAQLPKKVSPARKPLKQYNTMLEAEHIMAVKRLAVEESKKDYEVVQEALVTYLKKKGTL